MNEAPERSTAAQTTRAAGKCSLWTRLKRLFSPPDEQNVLRQEIESVEGSLRLQWGTDQGVLCIRDPESDEPRYAFQGMGNSWQVVGGEHGVVTITREREFATQRTIKDIDQNTIGRVEPVTGTGSAWTLQLTLGDSVYTYDVASSGLTWSTWLIKTGGQVVGALLDSTDVLLKSEEHLFPAALLICAGTRRSEMW